MCKRFLGLWRCICVARKVLVYKFLNQGDTMKQLIALFATLSVATAFAAEPAKKEEKKVEAKPAVTAPATPAKSEPAKKDAPKADAKAATPAAK